MRIEPGGAYAPSLRASGASTQLLGELDADALLLERREVLDEDLAAQMIHLVLNANRQQSLGLHRQRIAARVIGAHTDAIGALHGIVDAQHRKASLLDVGDAPALDNL